MPYVKTLHSRSLQTFAVFLPKMAKHDVTKTQFSQTILDGFSRYFGGRRQIGAGEGTGSFASISVAVFELLRKFDRGRNSPPPLQWDAF